MKLLKFLLLFGSFLLLVATLASCNQDVDEFEDNEFAEFEDFDEGQVMNDKVEEPKKEQVQSVPVNKQDEEDEDDDAVVETEDDEWDPEEFDTSEPVNEQVFNENKVNTKSNLKILNVPRGSKNWTNYYVEIFIMIMAGLYLINYIVGSSKNHNIAAAWLQTHSSFLKSQFELVGDDPTNQNAVSTNQLIKESEHSYVLWCSGRNLCEGMLTTIKMIKRQDIVSNVWNYVSGTNNCDQILIQTTLTSMDPYVFCIGNKKSLINLQKNYTDVSLYCGDRLRSSEKFGFSPSMVMLSEVPSELASSIFDQKVLKVLKDNEHLLDYLHISDQFSGLKPQDQEEQVVEPPKVKKVLNMVLNIPSDCTTNDEMEKLLPLFKLSVFLVDKISKLKLSRESKKRTDKHRADVQHMYMKQTHLQRQEQAMLRREEKDKMLKEKMMLEENPDKQRRMDEMIQRREQSKKMKKMMKGNKYKVKSM